MPLQAKTEIERSWSEMERKAERSLLDAADLHKRGLETSIAKAMDLFASEDTSAGGRQLLSRQSFLKCLKSPIIGLPRSEVGPDLSSLTRQLGSIAAACEYNAHLQGVSRTEVIAWD